MTSVSERAAAAIRQLCADHARALADRELAKLYSQHTRLGSGRPALSAWGEADTQRCLDLAVRLTHAGLAPAHRESDGARVALLRAGEIMEWLSHEENRVSPATGRLLSAGLYQLAGYPARASGVLNVGDSADSDLSTLLRAFLAGDFATTLSVAVRFGSVPVAPVPEGDEGEVAGSEPEERLQDELTRHVVRALGVVAASLRWGDAARLPDALENLRKVSRWYLRGDPYSWLLAMVSAECGRAYDVSSLRRESAPLADTLSDRGRASLERYLRLSYLRGRTLAWPSQARGIRKLCDGVSFALCTPTGSGKTAVAELAIVQSVFGREEQPVGPLGLGSIALYLTPSRALAAEVESKLAATFGSVGQGAVRVTGLYGGTDWGPTDAWLTSAEATVLICTYEKAEALVRFLGAAFVGRVRLVVIDEAQSVQLDHREGSFSECRSLRLETVSARLLGYLEGQRGRVIALSAVADTIGDQLAGWVSGDPHSQPVRSSYRSTRQVIGRLLVTGGRGYVACYDLVDGALTTYSEDDHEQVPWIPDPIAGHPRAPSWDSEARVEKRLRPALLWAGCSMAQPDSTGRRRGVLVYAPHGVSGYAKDFLQLLERDWATEPLPAFFTEPEVDSSEAGIWDRCLEACLDYFGPDSYEYRLLKRGVAVHHGRMPGSLARSIVELIDARVVSVVLSTSTLSEGVNLPFETVLIPTLFWRGRLADARELANVVGRAGRPGSAIEGRTLVLMSAGQSRQEIEALERYRQVIRNMAREQTPASFAQRAESALAALLDRVHAGWSGTVRREQQGDFENWLETVTVSDRSVPAEGPEAQLADDVDVLDSALLSALVEAEQAGENAEEALQRYWRHTYARFAADEEQRLRSWFMLRGRAVRTFVYPDPARRRRLYRSGLPPRRASSLLDLWPSLKKHLATGDRYATWLFSGKLEYVERTASLLGQVPTFAMPSGRGLGRADWRAVLAWWLGPQWARARPTADTVGAWHSYVSANFRYRLSWGVGSAIALALDDAHGGETRSPTLEDWATLDLPWVVFWLKELMVWGTLEPVAAYLLARRLEHTRQEAETAAQGYYDAAVPEGSPDDWLDARSIRDWASERYRGVQREAESAAAQSIPVRPLRDLRGLPATEWHVLPVQNGDSIVWLDPAGYPLAQSVAPAFLKRDLDARYIAEHDFLLHLDPPRVTAQRYV